MLQAIVAAALLVSGPEIAVVDRGSQTVKRVHSDGSISVLAAGFSDVINVVRLADGNLYVSDRGGAGTLTTLDAATGSVVHVESPGFRPDDLSLAADGTIWASGFYDGVWKKSPGGSAWSSVAGVPGDLTYLAQVGGFVYVNNAGAQFFRVDASSGAYAQIATEPSQTHGLLPFGGDLLIAEFGAGRVDRVSGFAPGGSFRSAPFATGLPSASGLTADAQGNVYVSLQDNPGSIYKLDAQGNATAIVDHSPLLTYPRGLAVLESDATPPVTTASLSGTQGAAGWYRSSVTVALSASDPDDAVASTRYRIDGGDWTAYAGPFTVAAEGIHAVSFQSTDSHGNTEAVNEAGFTIDETPPAITASARIPVLWPPEHQMVLETIDVSVSDNLDPAPSWAVVSATSSEPALARGSGHTAVDIEVLSATAIDLRAERSGGGSGRLYSIRYRATDKAGNSSESTAYVRVPHDLGR